MKNFDCYHNDNMYELFVIFVWQICYPFFINRIKNETDGLIVFGAFDN